MEVAVAYIFPDIFFAAETHAVVVCFNEDPDIVRDLVHLEEGLEGTRRGYARSC